MLDQTNFFWGVNTNYFLGSNKVRLHMRSFPIGLVGFCMFLWSLVSGLFSLVSGHGSLVSGHWDQKNVFLQNITILFVFIDFRGADASFTLNQAGLGGVGG